FLAWGLLELYAADFRAAHLAAAIDLVRVLAADFRDSVRGGFYHGPPGGDPRIVRRTEVGDGVIPSAQSVLLHVLLRLERLTAESAYGRLAGEILAVCPPDAERQPIAFSFFLTAGSFRVGPAAEIVVCGRRGSADTGAMLSTLRARFLPNVTVIFRGEGEGEEIDRIAPFAASCRMVGSRATAYACRDFTCSLPTNDPAAMIDRLGS
ncbi:MAG TPA: thioredoxin domain-containing protein, partial [Spirochaetia bacterium]